MATADVMALACIATPINVAITYSCNALTLWHFFLARTKIVAIENVAMKIVGGNNKLCNENNFEARNNIATSYCSWLVKIVASAPSGCNNKWCNLKFVEARSKIASRYGSRFVTIILNNIFISCLTYYVKKINAKH